MWKNLSFRSASLSEASLTLNIMVVLERLRFSWREVSKTGTLRIKGMVTSCPTASVCGAGRDSLLPPNFEIKFPIFYAVNSISLRMFHKSRQIMINWLFTFNKSKFQGFQIAGPKKAKQLSRIFAQKHKRGFVSPVILMHSKAISHKIFPCNSQVVVVVKSNVDGDRRLEDAVALVGADQDARGQRPHATAVRQPLVPRRRGQILALRQSGLNRAKDF